MQIPQENTCVKSIFFHWTKKENCPVMDLRHMLSVSVLEILDIAFSLKTFEKNYLRKFNKFAKKQQANRSISSSNFRWLNFYAGNYSDHVISRRSELLFWKSLDLKMFFVVMLQAMLAFNSTLKMKSTINFLKFFREIPKIFRSSYCFIYIFEQLLLCFLSNRHLLVQSHIYFTWIMCKIMFKVNSKDTRTNFHKFHWKTSVPESLLNNVVGLSPATLLKKRLWHRYFPVDFANFLRTVFLQNPSGWLLLFSEGFWDWFANSNRTIHTKQLCKFVSNNK